jgi:hypothetical protein
MEQPGGGKPERPKPQGARPGGPRGEKGRSRRRRPRRPAETASPPPAPVNPGRVVVPGTKVCRKCGGPMHPADWIWQKYGLCLGWRCANCKEKVMARSLPFKGLRKRTLDPDELPAAVPSDVPANPTAVKGKRPIRKPEAS